MSKLFNFWLNSSKEEIFISVGPDDSISSILCARSAVSSDLYLVKDGSYLEVLYTKWKIG